MRYPSDAGVSSMVAAALLRVEEPLGDGAVGVDPAVAKERPVAPGLLLETRVARDHQHLFGVVAGPGEQAAERVGQERAAPELEPAVGRPFVADAVDGGDEHAVIDRV